MDVSSSEQRSYLVVKDNAMIQKSRYVLSLTEQRIILFLISKVKPEDTMLQKYSFTIREFCSVCGLDTTQGSYYGHVKDTIRNLRDKSFWVRINSKQELLFAWIDSVLIDQETGLISVKLSDSIMPYLLGLKKKFTAYELSNILAMRKTYSIRLYELLKSYAGLQVKSFSLDELRVLLNAEHYDEYYDLKRRVIEPALSEINDLTDLKITQQAVKTKNKVTGLRFVIETKTPEENRLTIIKRKNIFSRHQSLHIEQEQLFIELLEELSNNIPSNL